MRYLIIVRATEQTEAGEFPDDAESLFAEMMAYHEKMQAAGVLVDGSGLKPSSAGWRIAYDGQERTVLDGPFAETKELIAGYTVIDVATRQEAMDWAMRFPNPAGRGGVCQIEVRPFYEPADFEGHIDMEKVAELRAGLAQDS